MPAAPSAPVACSLSAEGRVSQLDQWRDLLTSVVDERGIDGGVRVSLPVDRLAEAASLAAAEQACCPFFDFRLHLAGALIHLEMRAPAEAAALLAELLHRTQVGAR